MKKRVCISFDYTEDNKYRNLLKAWDAHSNFEFSMSDKTPNEISSNSYNYIKTVLSLRIKEANILLVVVGAETNTRHPNYLGIGEKNWQIWEIEKAKDLGKKIVAVKIKKTYVSPQKLLNSGVSWAMSFTQESILNALKN